MIEEILEIVLEAIGNGKVELILTRQGEEAARTEVEIKDGQKHCCRADNRTACFMECRTTQSVQSDDSGDR